MSEVFSNFLVCLFVCFFFLFTPSKCFKCSRQKLNSSNQYQNYFPRGLIVLFTFAVADRFYCTTFFLFLQYFKVFIRKPKSWADLGGGCRGALPPPPEMTCGFLIQLVFCKKKNNKKIKKKKIKEASYAIPYWCTPS